MKDSNILEINLGCCVIIILQLRREFNDSLINNYNKTEFQNANEIKKARVVVKANE